MLVIDNNFSVIVDAHNHVLRRKTSGYDTLEKNEDGSRGWVNIGYYSDMKGCLVGYFRQLTKDQIESSDLSIPELIKRIDHIEEYFKDYKGVILEFNKKVIDRNAFKKKEQFDAL